MLKQTATNQQLNWDNVLIVYVVACLCTPVFTYVMAVKEGEEKPFPNPSITDTACYYPQDIVFRLVMLTSAPIIALTFYMMVRWMDSQAHRVGFALFPRWQFYLALGSVFFYSVTIGTIDGLDIGIWHTPCAYVFFIIWMMTVFSSTRYLTKLREWDTSVMCRASLTLKQLFALYIVLVWTVCIVGITTSTYFTYDEFINII